MSGGSIHQDVEPRRSRAGRQGKGRNSGLDTLRTHHVPMGYPSGDVQWASGFMGLELEFPSL